MSGAGAGTGPPGPTGRAERRRRYAPHVLPARVGRSAAVVVPVKAFSAAKVRLAPALDPPARAALARRLADVVVRAASPLRVVVVCDDDEVHDWAVAAGAEVVWCPDRGLNGAVADGVAALRDDGVEQAIVAHADLPLARELAWVADFPGVTLVPDRRRDGSNVVSVPTGADFGFSYGSGSFARHRAEAARLALPLRIVDDADLRWDVDVPADLDWPDRPDNPDHPGRPRHRNPASGDDPDLATGVVADHVRT